MIKAKQLLFLLFYSIGCTNSFSHNPDEINYNILINKEHQQLTIQTTPIGIIHLLKKQVPTLENESIIHPSSYLTELELYFNETIELIIDNKSIQFKLIKHDLNSHNATLRYKLDAPTPNPKEVTVNIMSFTNIYKSIKNHVSINVNGKLKNCTLNTLVTDCFFIFKKAEPLESTQFYYYFISLIIILLSLGYMLKKRYFN